MSPSELTALLAPYAAVSPSLASQLLLYLDLILKWNARGPGSPAGSPAGVGINLTAIRTPEDIVRRHFGESLFTAAHLGPCSSLLDFGSGAGFPGLPIQLAHPTLPVTLAESRARKAAFLQEAVRTLQLPTEVWPHRVESLPAARTFSAVTLRAVDSMPAALAGAALRATDKLLILSTLPASLPTLPGEFTLDPPIPLPESTTSALLIARRR
jgi:16S rRNA (guanine527-N7)-methyltransferase